MTTATKAAAYREKCYRILRLNDEGHDLHAIARECGTHVNFVKRLTTAHERVRLAAQLKGRTDAIV